MHLFQLVFASGLLAYHGNALNQGGEVREQMLPIEFLGLGGNPKSTRTTASLPGSTATEQIADAAKCNAERGAS